MAGMNWGIARGRCRWNRIISGTILILPLMTLPQAHGFDPGRGPPTDTGPPPIAPAPEGAPDIKPGGPPGATPLPPRNDAGLDNGPEDPGGDNWHHNLIRERPTEVRLRSARKEIQAGHFAEAIGLLQAVLDNNDDVFVRLEWQPAPSGARFLADQLLSSLPADAREIYETLHGSEARRLLIAARSSGDPQALIEVVRRFFHTTAGAEAIQRLAHYWLDHGNVELAADCWRRLLSEPAHRRNLQPAQRVAAAACFVRAGASDEAMSLADSLANAKVRLGGGDPVKAGNWIDSVSRSTPAPEQNGALVGGAADRNGAHPGSIPLVAHPRWKLPLAGSGSQHVAALAAAWEPYQIQNGQLIGASQFPILAGGLVIFRDFEGLRAVDPETGTTVWEFATASSLGREIPARPSVPTEGNPDPNNAMHALVGNCLLGMLAASSDLVFAIDQVETDQMTQVTASTSTNESQAISRRQSNVLMAIPLRMTGVAERKPYWSVGGRLPGDEDEVPRRTMAGHYFVGPPLPLRDRVFTVSEFRQQLHLSCLAAGTGALLWTQPICSVPQPISSDYHRKELVCSPTYADGVIVCPTQAGVLVAADPLTGRLLWAASHEDDEPQFRQQMSAWPYSSRKRYSHRGYTNLPIIHEGRVVFLPSHSEYLHCFDLASGKMHWRARRDDLELSNAGDYVAAVAEKTILLVGRRRIRGIDLETGAPRYEMRMGSSPAGRGVRLGGSYFIPLDDGRVAGIELATGAPAGIASRAPIAELGNLVAAGDSVLSMGRFQIVAWPQAEVALDRLELESRQDPTRAIAAAEIELALGRTDAALARLTSLRAGKALQGGAATIQDLEREIVLARLRDPESDRAALLSRLKEIASEPAEQARYLLERALDEYERNDIHALMETGREIGTLDLLTTFPLLGDPSRSVAPEAFVTALIRHRRRHESGLARFQMSADQEALGQHRVALRRAIDWSAAGADADGARLRFARLLLSGNHDQQAELVLLEARESRDLPTAGIATRLLAELWQKRKMAQQSGRMLAELRSRFATVDVGDGITGREFVSRIPQDDPARRAAQCLDLPAWTGIGVTIDESRTSNESLQSLYKGSGVPMLTTPRHLPFDVFDKGRGIAAQFTLVDRATGDECPETIQFPGRYAYPVVQQRGYLQHSYVGNFVALGGQGQVHGMSLLERRIVWTASPPFLAGTRDSVRIGPSGPGFCACQLRQHLFVVDPADGRVLWHRDDLDGSSGLMMMSDPVGMIGDERVLTVFSGQGTHYTVYDTATGAELRRGRLDVQNRPNRRAYGRRLFHFTCGEQPRMRVWDPLTDSFVWDAPADELAEASVLEGVTPGTKVFSFVRDSNEAAYVTRDGRLRVVDLARGEELFDLALSQTQLENLSFIGVFRDHERYFVNLQRTQLPSRTLPAATYIISDATIPTVHIQGELLAVDRQSHEVLWSRSLGNRSVLQLPEYQLPVMITLFRVRKDDQTLLAAEVLDLQSGRTLASREDLLSDCLLQVFYERNPGRILVRGGKSEIRFQFPEGVAQADPARR